MKNLSIYSMSSTFVFIYITVIDIMGILDDESYDLMFGIMFFMVSALIAEKHKVVGILGMIFCFSVLNMTIFFE